MPLAPWKATVDPHLCWRLPNTQANLAQSLVGSLLISPELCAHKILLCPPRVCFPGDSQSFCKISSLGNLLWTFATVQELLCYNRSPVSGSSAWQLYSGINGNLLQKDLCHKLHLPSLLQPETLYPQQVTADPCLCRRHSNTQRQVWLSLLWGSLFLFLDPGAHKGLFVPSEHLWWV